MILLDWVRGRGREDGAVVRVVLDSLVMGLIIAGLVVSLECELDSGLIEVFITLMAPIAPGLVATVLHVLEGPFTLDIPMARAVAETCGPEFGSSRIKLVVRCHPFRAGGGKFDGGFGFGFCVTFAG